MQPRPVRGGRSRPSLPSRGAWIEILFIVYLTNCNNRRSPHGERGLKLVMILLFLMKSTVAPLTGSVD